MPAGLCKIYYRGQLIQLVSQSMTVFMVNMPSHSQLIQTLLGFCFHTPLLRNIGNY
jgi:hypothetical protein